MSTTIRALRLLPALVVLLPNVLLAASSEIAIQNTAIEKMLKQELFIDRGRYNLVQETRCQYAYLDSPAVSISDGRVRIKVRLSGKLGMEVGEKCVGAGSDVVRLTVSGKPTYAAEKIGLTDIRLDEVSNEAYRFLLQQFLESAVPRAVSVDVREGLQRVLADRQAKVEVTVSQLTVTELTAEDNLLHAMLTFSLVAR
ncbi:MAG TPA: hypothetical protein VN496_05270 [Burkholderiales bacterium]|nr:hypothetical protein [Burkholderiales bacterium]